MCSKSAVFFVDFSQMVLAQYRQESNAKRTVSYLFEESLSQQKHYSPSVSSHLSQGRTRNAVSLLTGIGVLGASLS